MREILSAVERFLFEHLLTRHLDVTRLSCRQNSTLFRRLPSGDRLQLGSPSLEITILRPQCLCGADWVHGALAGERTHLV